MYDPCRCWTYFDKATIYKLRHKTSEAHQIRTVTELSEENQIYKTLLFVIVVALRIHALPQPAA